MKLTLYLFLSIFICSIVYSFYFDWTRVNQISFSVQGSWMKKKDQVLSDLKKETHPLLGQRIWKVSIQDIHKAVQDHPQVEEVQVLRSWPSSFHVRLLSSKPLLLLMGNKVFHPITEKGGMLPSLKIHDLPDLPFLRGNVFFKSIEMRKKAVSLVQHLPQKGYFSQNSISEIKYSKKDSSFYLYLLDSGSVVRIGENLSEFRPDRIESVLAYLKQKQINWQAIDARYSQKVIVSLVKAI